MTSIARRCASSLISIQSERPGRSRSARKASASVPLFDKERQADRRVFTNQLSQELAIFASGSTREFAAKRIYIRARQIGLTPPNIATAGENASTKGRDDRRIWQPVRGVRHGPVLHGPQQESQERRALNPVGNLSNSEYCRSCGRVRAMPTYPASSSAGGGSLANHCNASHSGLRTSATGSRAWPGSVTNWKPSGAQNGEVADLRELDVIRDPANE